MMTDPMPVGYLGLDEAVPRLAAAFHKDAAAAERLGPAELAWAKREIATGRLHAALRDNALVGLVRDPASGGLFRLTSTDWHGLSLWRDTIISGVVHASLGEEIARHNGRRVLLSASEFDVWLEQLSQQEPLATHLLEDGVRADTRTEETPAEPAVTTKPIETQPIAPANHPAKAKPPSDWIAEAFSADSAALTQMSITDASKHLKALMRNAVRTGHCSKELTPRSIEGWLRRKKLIPPTK
jgi:hypothetical protein